MCRNTAIFRLIGLGHLVAQHDHQEEQQNNDNRAEGAVGIWPNVYEVCNGATDRACNVVSLRTGRCLATAFRSKLSNQRCGLVFIDDLAASMTLARDSMSDHLAQLRPLRKAGRREGSIAAIESFIKVRPALGANHVRYLIGNRFMVSPYRAVLE